MKYDWKKKLSAGTKVKLITRKGHRYSSVKGTVVSHDGGKLVIKGDNGKEFVRKEPQRITLPEMKTLTESINLSEIQSMFLSTANKVWKSSKALSSINYSFLLVPNKEMKGRVLMSVAYVPVPTTMAVGNNLIYAPPKVTVRVNERLFELPPDKIQKIVTHETVHLGYPNHGSDFMQLCLAHGGAPSELSASEEGWKVQVKKGSRFATVKTFPANDLEAARAYGRELWKQTPGEKVRLIMERSH